MIRKPIIIIVAVWASSLFLSILLLACHKDNPVCLACESCEPLIRKKDSGISITNAPFHKDTLYKSPCFNPNNSNEFVYFKQYEKQLVKRNITTGGETILLEKIYINSQLNWNKQGWIVFAGLDLAIYKIRDNGLDFQPVTTVFSNIFPALSPDGNTIITSATGGSPEEGGNKLISIDGKRLDSIGLNEIENMMFPTAWSSKKEIVGGLSLNASAQYGLGLFNLITRQFQLLYKVDYITAAPQINCIQWHQNGEDVYFTTLWDGFYKMNVKTLKKEYIKNTCNSRTYINFSISADATKIIAQRRDAKLINGGYDILDYDYIVIMDIDGKNERVLVK